MFSTFCSYVLLFASAHIQRPATLRAQPECAVDEAPLVEVRGNVYGRNALEVWVLTHSGSPGGVAVIRLARNSDVSITPSLFRDPLDRVIAVADLIDTTETTFRLESPAHILCDVRVTLLRPEATQSRHHAVGALLVVWHPCQDDGEWARRIGQIDVSEETHPIAHGRGNVDLHDDAVVVDLHLRSISGHRQGLFRGPGLDWRIHLETTRCQVDDEREQPAL